MAGRLSPITAADTYSSPSEMGRIFDHPAAFQSLRQLQRTVQPRLGIRPGAVEDQLAVGAQLGQFAQPLDIGEQAVDIGRAIVVERDQHAARPDIHLGDARRLGVQLDLDDLDQIVGRLGQRAEAVDHLGGEFLHFLVLFQIVEATIQPHAQVEIGT